MTRWVRHEESTRHFWGEIVVNGFSLQGRVAAVTGGTSGIGLAIGRALAEAGAHVVLSGRSEARGEEAVRLLQDDGLKSEFRLNDAVDSASNVRLIESVVEEHGCIDALVTCAGGLMVKPALDITPEELDELLSIHIRGAFTCAQAAARTMISQVRGKILFVTSLLAERAIPNQAAYIAAKGGLVALARALAVEWAPHGIQVNALGPQLTRTPLTEGLYADPKKMQAVLTHTPAGRGGEPEDVAGAAVFLCSPASDYLTGQHIIVDGGRSVAA
jgi:gluconate 5-dehydrogenase